MAPKNGASFYPVHRVNRARGLYFSPDARSCISASSLTTHVQTCVTEMVDTCGLEPRTHPCGGCVLPNYTTGPFEIGVPTPVPPRSVLLLSGLTAEGSCQAKPVLAIRPCLNPHTLPVTCLTREKVASQISPASVALVRWFPWASRSMFCFGLNYGTLLKLIDVGAPLRWAMAQRWIASAGFEPAR